MADMEVDATRDCSKVVTDGETTESSPNLVPTQVTRGDVGTISVPPPPPRKSAPQSPQSGEKVDPEAEQTPEKEEEEDLQPQQQQVSETEISKWNEMMEGEGITHYMRQHPDRFHRRVRRGIPPQYRWEVWKAAVHLAEHEDILSQDYESLSTRANSWTSVIEIDIGRTFPELKSFSEDKQYMLWRVLNAYASYNPTLGYCQGMNFVAGLLLLVSNYQEEESFGVLVCLMDHVGLSGFYGEKLPLFKRYLRACDMLVKETVPELREHFKKENVNAPVYLHQWFLTLFINCFPLSMVTIIWDVIICEGLEVVLRIAVSILQVLKDSLLAMQFEEIIKFFKMMKTYDDEDGELNAFRIGQLLMKHTELVKVPQNILDELRSDAADDEPFVDYDENWEGGDVNGSTWLSVFGRVVSGFNMFNYGVTRKRSSASSLSRSTSDASSTNATPIQSATRMSHTAMRPNSTDGLQTTSAENSNSTSVSGTTGSSINNSQRGSQNDMPGWEFL